MVGGGPVVVPPPPMVIVPLPVKVKVKLVLTTTDPVRDGKEPIEPDRLPVPPVIVADPLPVFVRKFPRAMVPVSVPVVPLVSVMVNGVGVVVSVVRFAFALNVPLPRLVRIAVPVNAIADDDPRLPVAFTVIVVLVGVAACAPKHASMARVKPASIRIIRPFAILSVFRRFCICSLLQGFSGSRVYPKSRLLSTQQRGSEWLIQVKVRKRKKIRQLVLN